MGLINAAYEVVRQAKLQVALVKAEARNEHLKGRPMVQLHRLPDGIVSWVDLEVNNNSPMEPSNRYGDGSESKEEAKARVFKRF